MDAAAIVGDVAELWLKAPDIIRSFYLKLLG